MIRTEGQQQKTWLQYLATYGLWLGSAALAVIEIGLFRNLVMSVYAWIVTLQGRTALVRTTFTGASLGMWAAILMGIVAIGIIIGGFEYHHKRVGDPKALRVLAWTIGIQAVILIPALLV